MAQRLVHEELARRGLALSDEEKFREEQRISAGYGLEPGQAFDAFINRYTYSLWREQLYVRLELELLQRELAASILVFGRCLRLCEGTSRAGRRTCPLYLSFCQRLPKGLCRGRTQRRQE